MHVYFAKCIAITPEGIYSHALTIQGASSLSVEDTKKVGKTTDSTQNFITHGQIEEFSSGLNSKIATVVSRQRRSR